MTDTAAIAADSVAFLRLGFRFFPLALRLPSSTEATPDSLSNQDAHAAEEESAARQAEELHLLAMKDRAFMAPPLRSPSAPGDRSLLRPHSRPFAVIKLHDVSALSNASLCPTCTLKCSCCALLTQRMPLDARCCAVCRNTMRKW